MNKITINKISKLTGMSTGLLEKKMKEIKEKDKRKAQSIKRYWKWRSRRSIQKQIIYVPN